MTPAEAEAELRKYRTEIDAVRTRLRVTMNALRGAEEVLGDLMLRARVVGCDIAASEVISVALAAVRDALMPRDYLNGRADVPCSPPPSRKPVTFDIPAGATSTTCRSCGALLFWVKMPGGKNMPCNADGTSHFSTCPQAAEHRKPRGGP